jgi:hypothetical protein
MVKIRIIIDNNNNKMYEQYNQISKLFPLHIVYIYKNSNKNIEEKVDYNIFIDVISENVLNLCPSIYTILLVNEEYIHHKYLRRERYIDTPLRLIKDVVDYYFCLTVYAKNILKPKNKIKYFDGLTGGIYSTKLLNYSNNVKRYILYDVDLYSAQDNVIMLQTWMKYFLDRPEYLVISYKFHIDSIVRFNYDLMKNKFYKNIILIDEYVYDENIYASIVNTSYYNATTSLYQNILNKRVIITTKNDISNNFLQKMLLINSFNEHDLKNALNQLFKYKMEDIIKITDNNKNLLIKSIVKTKKKVFKFFKNTEYKQNSITNSLQIIPGYFFFNILKKKKIIQLHSNIKQKMDDIDNKFNKLVKNNSKYYRILKEPSKSEKTDCAFATMIMLGNSYISSILATGYIMKYMNKTKYNLICFVQDKPTLTHKCLTPEEINDIGKFYDCIVGVDLIDVKINNIKNKFNKHYSNLQYYVTKYLFCSFTEYSKILYYDASTIIQKNIDYYMTKYNENKYYNTDNENLNRGLAGNIVMIIPKSYYIDKLLYISKNYYKLFKNTYIFNTPDENIIYYSVYPNWSKKQIDYNEIYSNLYMRWPYLNVLPKDIDKIQKYNFSTNIIIKPFLYNDSNSNKESERRYQINSTFFNANHICYKLWDLAIAEIIKLYPELYKYVEFIKTYRYTLF